MLFVNKLESELVDDDWQDTLSHVFSEGLTQAYPLTSQEWAETHLMSFGSLGRQIELA